MNIEQLYPKKWLSAADLAGRCVTVTISAVSLEQVRNPRTNREEPKLAVAFEGKQKRLLLNKTQAYALAAIGSKETDGWAGMQVTLSPAVAPNGAQTIAIGPALAREKDAGSPPDVPEEGRGESSVP
jgi:hypothetical protein